MWRIAWFHVARWLCWATLRVWCHLRVEGSAHLPARGPFVVAANHRSYLDPPAVGAAVPRFMRFIAKDELFRARWIGPLIRSLSAISVTVSDPRAVNHTVLKQAAEALRQGHCVAIFPEGRRNVGTQVDAAKFGVAFIAARAQVPIVPVAIIGSDAALPEGATSLRRARMIARIGAPIPPPVLTPQNRHEAYAQLAQRVTLAIAQLYENK